MSKFILLLFLFLIKSAIGFCQETTIQTGLDVLSYDLYLEPDIKKKSVKGIVTIIFNSHESNNVIEFQSGSLKVDSVSGKNIKGFKQHKGTLSLNLIKGKSTLNKVILYYHGKPERGLLFQQDKNHAYTVFHTNEWMICNMAPNDRATISLELVVPDSLNCIANGTLVSKKRLDADRISYQWKQEHEAPSYAYGFVISKLKSSQQCYGEIALNFYSPKHSTQQLDSIFQYSSVLMSFLEKKSGISYEQSSYSQVLIGRHYQEMSGFAVLKDSYGKLVLADNTETNLITHELAHQWWGNSITCENWNHMWLNEGFATYMSAAYNEYRFGKAKYDADIRSYFKVYENLKNKGLDKSLVFSNWESPSKDDRNLVYFKGAYVLHKLREELGDVSFWKAIKYYSQTYCGKSVTTEQFKKAIEESTKQNLDSFFKQWIY